MTKKKQKQKIKVYIDGANMFYAQKKLGWTIDWKKVRDIMQTEYDVVEIKYYTGIKKGDEKMAKYLKYLDKVNFTVITKPLKTIKIDKNHHLNKLYNYTEMYKSNFDVEITTDMIFDRQNIDELILFSGDSDFRYMVDRLNDVGKKVIVYSSRKTLSWELKLAVSRYFYIDNYKDKFMRE